MGKITRAAAAWLVRNRRALAAVLGAILVIVEHALRVRGPNVTTGADAATP